jgi:phenylacetate-coenzyme A ligase PaaK-like adenylate-forming protein
MTGELSDHRTSALAATLRYVRLNSPFYRERLQRYEITQDATVEVLRSLPSLSAEEWHARREEIRTGQISDVIIGYTGGSTGLPKPILSTAAERGAFQEIIRGTSQFAEPMLNLVGPGHGVQAADDFGSGVITVPLAFSEPDLELVACILERKVVPYTALAPFAALCGSVYRLAILSMYLLERRGRIDDLGIKSLVIDRVPSARWRDLLEQWWGAHIEVLYGFSELRMCNSRICEHCNNFHLPPTCFGEVLDPDNRSPVSESVRRGVLTVTAFYPFVQLEPRIRYYSGDLVEVADVECPFWDEPGFAILGRERYAIRLKTGEWLTPMDCFNAIADIPDVARSDFPAAFFAGGGPRYRECASPRFSLERDPNGIVLNVELRYDPLVWPRRARELCEQIAETLPVSGVSVTLHRPDALPGERCRI